MKHEICVVTDTLDRRRGGAETYLANLVEYLVHDGHAVHVCLRRRCQNLPPVELDVEVVPTRHGSHILRDWHFARSIKRRLARSHAIVLSNLIVPGITHYQPHSGLLRAAFAAACESHDPGISRRFSRLGNRLNPRCSWLVAMQEQLLTREPRPSIMTFSNALRTRMLEAYRIPPSDVVAVYHGVDLSRFRPGRETDRCRGSAPGADRLQMLFAGHNFRLKGLHCLLRAMAAAVRQGLRADLLVVGGGPRAPFQRLASSLGLASQVSFRGIVENTEMGSLYRASDVLVHPAFIDHCSLVVLEALACGRPVITTRQNGAAELISAGKQGIILDHPRQIEALTDALLGLQDRRRLAEMSEAALALRPRLDFADHARQVSAWLTDGSREGI